MLGDKRKACPGQGEVVGFTGGGTEDVVQLVIDRDDVMPTGEYMLQEIRRNGNHLTVRPHIFRGDAFTASLFACQSQRMVFPHDTDKGIIMEFLEGNILSSEFGILDAHYQIQLTGGEPVQIGIGLVKGQLRHDVLIICQHLGENLADKPVGMRVSVANARGVTLPLPP